VVGRRPAFLARVYTPAEVADCLRGGVAVTSPVAAARLAARFAAKEAARKALGAGLAFREVEVRRDRDGRTRSRGQPAAAALSLAHDAGVAIALVVAPAAPLQATDRSEE
jgi:phosphopantetheinyl transferase (holo-ACP synthase)